MSAVEGFQLEGQSAHAWGLRMLALQPHLKLAFLNGCSTQEQAQPYLEAGVPAILATTHSILDAIFVLVFAILVQMTIQSFPYL